MGRNEEYRESFDLCVSRAVANLSSLSEYCLPFVQKQGWFVSYKAGDIEKELKGAGRAIRLLGGQLQKVVKFELPGSNIERSFVVIKKSGTYCGEISQKGRNTCERAIVKIKSVTIQKCLCNFGRGYISSGD